MYQQNIEGENQMSITMPNDVDRTSLNQTKKDDVKFDIDPFMLVPKLDCKYELRLLYFLDDTSTRKKPYIINKNHTFYKRNDNGNMGSVFAGCPTTPRFDIDNPEEQCPFCIQNDLLWRQSRQDGDDKLFKIAKKFRAKFNAFMPVIVVNTDDPGVKINSVKILSVYSEFTFNDIINGIKRRKKLKFYNALTNPECMNLQLACYTSDTGYKNTKVLFVKTKKILASVWNEEKQEAFFNNMLKPLNFDRDYYKDFDSIRLNNLFNEYGAPLLSSTESVKNAPAKVKVREVGNLSKNNKKNEEVSMADVDELLREPEQSAKPSKPEKEIKANITPDNEDMDYIFDLLGDSE